MVRFLDQTGKYIRQISKDHESLFKPPFLSRLPKPISRFLGYRESPPNPDLWAIYATILIATFGGMLSNVAMAERAPLFIDHWHFTSLVPSFAASCILIYNAVDAPVSQPRSFIFGHLLSGIIGIGIEKLFLTNKSNFKYMWVSGSLSVAVSSIAMAFTGTVHPPAGATAMIPSFDPAVRDLGWDFLPVLVIHTFVFLGIALLVNNIFRQYPQYWLYPNTPAPAIKVTAKGISCPPGVHLSEEEEFVLMGIQKRMG